MNICFVTEDFYPNFIGGQGIYAYHLVSHLAKNGMKVTVLAENRAGRKDFWQRKKNINLTLVPFCFGNQLILGLLEYSIFIFRYRNRYFDILHANQLSGLFFAVFKPQNVGKVVISEWNLHYQMRQYTRSFLKKILYTPLISLERILYSLAGGIIFDSPKEQQEFKKFLKLDGKVKMAIYLGSEKTSFSRKEQSSARINLRNRLSLPEDARIVLFIGRLVERKKVDTVIKALAIIKRIDKSVYGVIVGDGLEKKKLESMAPPNVRFVGFDPSLRKFYLAADLFVTVSVAEGGFLLVGLEAAGFGLPLILSRSAAGFPIVKQGVNGYIVDPDDPQLLAEKIKQVLKNKDLMGKESSKIAKQFSWEKCSQETINFYQSLVGKQ